MSFDFTWPRHFSSSFYESAKNSLEQALNSGQKISLVADRIRVVDLNLGSIPPELDLLAIEELSALDGSFRGRFMLSYSGDAFISLATNLHVNPLTQYKHALEMLATPSVLLTTAEMFVQLTLSHLRLRCVISLSFSKTNGLVMVFRDDPLESLTVSSSFDSFGVVQQFIQSEIENQLRERFRRDLPSLIHRLSQKWCADMAQQTSTTDSHAPIVVEQVLHTPETETEPMQEREPDDSLPHNYEGLGVNGVRGIAASRSLSTSPAKPATDTEVLSDSSLDTLQFVSEDSDFSDTGDDRPSQSATNMRRSSTPGMDNLEHSYARSSLSVSPGEGFSRPSSWSSTWSRDETSAVGSPPQSFSPPRSMPARPGIVHQQAGSDSPIISSLKRSTSNFATTFSKAPVPVSVQDLHESLDDAKQGSAKQHPRRHRHSKRGDESRRHFQVDLQQELTADSPEARVPLATRKRLHRLEGSTPRTTPNNSPHKSRTLKNYKSRDRLRVWREDLDEYFPVTEDGSSTATAKDNVFTDSRSYRPSLLNSDLPMQVPMPASLIHSGKTDYPSKNSLRRTMMSSRLRERGSMSDFSTGASSRRPVVDRNFFTSNEYS